ncbi:MAG: hypothetical protein HY303_07770 [Candidatus Wallbacteria bacterium]|nr:hypothetical protein [Candidatus Wallbacteria bacterium]
MALSSGAKSELEALIHNIVHDLRSPLVTIESMVVLLRDCVADRLQGDELGYLEHIENGARLMRDLLGDLTELSLVKPQVEDREAVDTGEVLEQLLVEIAPEIAKLKGSVKAVGDLPAVHGDPGMVHIVFRELIDNGLKFRCEGVAPAIRISAQKTAGMQEFSVADEGIGIPEQYRDKVFGIFTKLHPRAKYGGNGIGLALVKRCVESQGGTVRIEAPQGPGTVVRFTLPV